MPRPTPCTDSRISARLRRTTSLSPSASSRPKANGMKLLVKLNLLLFLVFGLGLVLIAINARSFLLDGARKTVVNQVELMSASARAVRDYTEEEIDPILEKSPESQDTFLPQSIPF